MIRCKRWGQMTVMMDNNVYSAPARSLSPGVGEGIGWPRRVEWDREVGREECLSLWKWLFFMQGMRKESVYFYIQIFRLVIIEQFRRVTVLLVLISAVARWRMETALSHLEIKWSGVWLVLSDCGKEKMSNCWSSYAALCNELTDWIRNVHLQLSYRWNEYRTVMRQGDVVTRKLSLDYKIQISKVTPLQGKAF